MIQEQSLGLHYNTQTDLLDYLADRSIFDYHDGYVSVPIAPGLGIEIDEDKVRAASDHDFAWRNPGWRRHDGSVAEW